MLFLDSLNGKKVVSGTCGQVQATFPTQVQSGLRSGSDEPLPGRLPSAALSTRHPNID